MSRTLGNELREGRDINNNTTPRKSTHSKKVNPGFISTWDGAFTHPGVPGSAGIPAPSEGEIWGLLTILNEHEG